MKRISEIKEQIQAASLDELPEIIQSYRQDERSGVTKLLEAAGKKLIALEKRSYALKTLGSMRKSTRSIPICVGLMRLEEAPWQAR